MAKYVSIEQAVIMSGLRVVLPPGIPGPWAEAVKGILFVKKIPLPVYAMTAPITSP
jgi:hypothetical protein